MLSKAIAEFGQMLGFSELGPGSFGVTALEFEGGDKLFLEPLPEEDAHSDTSLALLLVHPLAPHTPLPSRKALGLCHYVHAAPFALYSGSYHDNFILGTVLEAEDLSAAGIDNALRFLMKSLDTLFRPSF